MLALNEMCRKSYVFMLPRSAMWLVLVFVGSALSAVAESPVDYGQNVRPILSDKCFVCHGPDADNRQADLRLDDRSHALDVLQPGRADVSAIIERIESSDPELVMPPPTTGKKISSAEREILKRWIDEGAKYSQHWAFTAPQRPGIPHTSGTWGSNPIDSFVLAGLEERQLHPSPEADRQTLIRRLYLDLLGLPPSPQELDRWLADDSSSADQRLIEHLMNSPHFGERWARWWLDAARYADSDGYEKDKQRSVWFYRDWVIQAMNADLPYDDFVIAQIAGDLLPNATQDSRVATGFLRNSMVNEEGGADPEQFRVEGMFDRMDAIGKSILGITTQCAQCHTHKYDPLSQREYYQMFAALNDFHEACITVFTPQQAASRDEVLTQIAALHQQVKQQCPDWEQQLNRWIQTARSRLLRWQVMTPSELPFSGQKFRLLEDGSIVSESYAPTRTSDTFKLTVDLDKITAFRLEALQHPQLPRGGPGRSIYGSGALTEFEVTVTPVADPKQAKKIKFAHALADVNPATSLLPAVFRDRDASQDRRVTGPIEYAIDGDPKTAWSTDVDPGRRNRNRSAVFVPEQTLNDLGTVELAFTLNQSHGGWNSDDNQNYLLGRYRFSICDDERAGQLDAATFLPLEIEHILLRPESDWSAEDWQALLDCWIAQQDEFAPQFQAIQAAWRTFPETDTQLVAESRASGPRETYVYTRGDFLRPTEAVQPAAPEFLGTLPDSGEPDRLRFARWLVRRDAPTTARVIVNRMWQAYFGRGLVTTPEDFGYQSPAPSHPDLLDWLAVELMEHNWSLKHIHQLIVSSASYRQQSHCSDELMQRDPANEWISRGPRVRVDAEIVRDIALRVSGLLNEQLGGPSVYPPAPEFLFEPPASYGPKIWATQTDSQQYRRSLYVHSYRSVAYPALQVFDAPKGDAACIRRERSNTPLQSLVMLNEPQFVDCARAMAARVIREAGSSDSQRLQYAHRLATGRPASAEEQAILLHLLEQQRQRIAAGELKADEILGVNGALSRQLTGQDAKDMVPWMIVSRALLNLDETITKQ